MNDLVSHDDTGGSPDPPQRALSPEAFEDLHLQHLRGLKAGESRASGSRRLLKLRHIDLTDRELELEGRMLRHAELLHVDFSGQNLGSLDLVGAELQGCSLRSTNLLLADLRNSVLEDCDFTAAKRLSAAQLGGSSIQGSTLPIGVVNLEIGALTDELIKNAKKISLLLNSACMYTVITVFSLAPGNSADSSFATLPLLGNRVPMDSFLYLSPVVILFLCIYFYLYLQRVWDSLARLPSVLVDGRAIPEHAYPWLPIGIMHFYSPVLKKRRRPPLSSLQLVACVFLTWFVVPVTIASLWLKSRDLLDLRLELLLGMTFLLVSGTSWLSYVYSARTLRNETDL